jgi:hypothetical protein
MNFARRGFDVRHDKQNQKEKRKRKSKFWL